MFKFLFNWLGIKKFDTSIYPQQHGEDWYWIGLGVSDVTAKQWDSREIKYSYSRNQRLDNVKKYRGGLRSDPKNWPAAWQAAYFETH